MAKTENKDMDLLKRIIPLFQSTNCSGESRDCESENIHLELALNRFLSNKDYEKVIEDIRIILGCPEV